MEREENDVCEHQRLLRKMDKNKRPDSNPEDSVYELEIQSSVSKGENLHQTLRAPQEAAARDKPRKELQTQNSV